MKSIFIRREISENEKRTPLIPDDVKRLIANNITVYVQTSTHRIYKDEEYKIAGAQLTDDVWFNEKYNKSLIIGIKDLPNLDKLQNHNHMYFSHSYKNQVGSEIILDAFSKSNSSLYDFEFFTNSIHKRIIAFGYSAGIVGAALGLRQYINKSTNAPDLANLTIYPNSETLINLILPKKPKVAVIGSLGRCGSGVTHVLDTLQVPYIHIGKDDDQIKTLTDYDIVYNCIVLDAAYTKVWLDTNTEFKKPLIIVDISCDYGKKNNPIQLYSTATTWQTPVYHYNSYVDIIAIDNLPSLLPKQSSDDFSNICADLILTFGSEIWQNCLNYMSLASKMKRKSEM
jgi:alanine dehydrogenase